MAGKFDFFRRYIFPSVVQDIHSAAAKMKGPAEGLDYYQSAIRNMLDEIGEPVRWSPKADMDLVDLTRLSPDDIGRVIRERGGDMTDVVSAMPRGMRGDIHLDPYAEMVGRGHTVIGSRGEGTPAALLHELGHVLDAKRNPMAYHMETLGKMERGIPSSPYASFGNVLGETTASTIAQSPSLISELRATMAANRALKAQNAPWNVRWDMWKRLGPALGTYFFPQF